MTFNDLGLSQELLEAVETAGYTQPTPIQEKAIPYVLMGRDILGCAQTGTGKTASFTLPMIDILAEGRAKARMPRSLILAPTRELASQVGENFDRYSKNNKLTKALLIGGASMSEQEQKLDRGVDVLIATPGRLIDLFERGKILLADVKILVIDEADRMLDMGFIPDVERIVGLLPPLRQTLFFSATMPKEIRKLADKFLLNPKEVTVTPPASAAETVTQRLIRCPSQDKRKTFQGLLGTENVASGLVFCNRKRDVSALAKALQKQGRNAGELHGDMSQPDRMATLQRFKDGEINILVCSDVAARGLDIPSVSHVFNYDVPGNPDDYIHRIGRTGRAGRSGKAVMIATPADQKALLAIEKMLQIEIPAEDTETAQALPQNSKSQTNDSEHTADEGRTKRRRSNRRKGPAPAQSTVAAPVEETGTTKGNRPQALSREGNDPAAAASDKPASVARSHASAPEESASEGPHSKKENTTKGGAPEKQQVPNGRQSKPFGDHTPAFLLRPVPASATA